jgi:hypothetical protein
MKLDSLLKFTIKQILIRVLANPQPYIWHKPPQQLAIACNFLMMNLSHSCFWKIVVRFEFHLQTKILCIRQIGISIFYPCSQENWHGLH